MIQFILNDVMAMNSAILLENGDTIQNCNLIISIEGLVIQNKLIVDNVNFTVPNSVMVGQQYPTIAGWEYIKNVLAPQWVEDNYKQI
jgi:hypothetical protein